MLRPAVLLMVLAFVPMFKADTTTPVAGARACYDCGYGCAHPAYHNDELGGVYLGFTAGVHVNYCHYSNCYAFHLFNCGGGETLQESQLDLLEHAAAAGNSGMLALYLRAWPGQVRYEPTRGAIQVSGCGGSIVASFPLAASAASIALNKAGMYIMGV